MRIVIDMQGAQSTASRHPQEQIVVWQTPGPVADANPENRWRRETGERLREAFLANLKPDVIYVSSLFEGFVDDAVTAVGALENALPTAITLYDLIRLLYQDIYLTDPVVRSSAITPDLYRSDWALVMWKSQ
jgi:hypothetical protein